MVLFKGLGFRANARSPTTSNDSCHSHRDYAVLEGTSKSAPRFRLAQLVGIPKTLTSQFFFCFFPARDFHIATDPLHAAKP